MDLLSVEDEAQAFSRLIASNGSKPPLSIGVFGRWGSGKSFFMTLISEELEKIRTEKPPGFHHRIVQIEFNAWHYMETNVWASFVDVIFKKLDAEFYPDGSAANTSLFDRLTTAQTMQLDAIERLAQRLEESQGAKKGLEKAIEYYNENGPNGLELWKTILDALSRSDKKPLPLLKNAAEILDQPNQNVAKSANENINAALALRDLATELKTTASEGKLAWRALNRRVTHPLPAALLFVLIIAPFLAAFISSVDNRFDWYLGWLNSIKSNLSQYFGYTLGALTGWGTLVCGWARRGVYFLHKAQVAIQNAEQSATVKQRDQLLEAKQRLDLARKTVHTAEENTAEALRAFSQESPGARLASFIKQRADSDDYSRHLGVIATIRQDFEQLSNLMSETTSKKKTDNQTAQFGKFREQINGQIKSIKSKHLKNFPKKTTGTTKEPEPAIEDDDLLYKKIQALENSLEEIPEGKEKFSRIVLKIDDLDRCPPDKVADVLQQFTYS